MDVGEEDLRSARRAALIVRVLVYGVLCAIAAALLAARFGDPPAEPLVGVTDQDAQIAIELDREQRPYRFDVQLFVTCPNGERWPARWWEVDSDRVPFERDGDRLRVEVDTGFHAFRNGDLARELYSFDGRVTDDRAEGVLRFTQQVDPVSGGADFECASGPVRFTAQR